MILPFEGKTPVIGKEVFIAPTAVVVGDVVIGDRASVWFGTVLRGDLAPIRVGKETNIQDNCTVHVDEGYPAVIGDRVSVGHNAVIHGCTVEDEVLVGIGARVLSGARIRTGAVVAANAVVREGQRVGPRELVAGAPATVKRTLSDEELARFLHPMKNYLRISRIYREKDRSPE
jgi:carbonic anhydrase/acetyltransferase-like protein (isoleucine patch superfamily)